MKKILLALLASASLTLFAQETAEPAAEAPAKKWSLGGNGSFTFNQISFKNWSAGGKNSVTGTFLTKNYANYKSENCTWDNTLDMGYGLTRYKGEDLQKSEDKIQLSSTYGYNAYKQKWFYSANFNFKTQFAKGYDYSSADTALVSKGFSPAYIDLAVGMLYKPNDVFSLFLSPVTGRMTIVGDTILSERYGLDPGSQSRFEYGATVKLTIDKKNLVKNVDYYLTSNFFSNLAENPEHIDVDLETGFNLHVNNWLTAVIKVNILFDDDTKYVESYLDDAGEVQTRMRGARVQMKELFGFGLAFNWNK